MPPPRQPDRDSDHTSDWDRLSGRDRHMDRNRFSGGPAKIHPTVATFENLLSQIQRALDQLKNTAEKAYKATPAPDFPHVHQALTACVMDPGSTRACVCHALTPRVRLPLLGVCMPGMLVLPPFTAADLLRTPMTTTTDESVLNIIILLRTSRVSLARGGGTRGTSSRQDSRPSSRSGGVFGKTLGRSRIGAIHLDHNLVTWIPGRPTSGRLPHGIYHFWMVYTMQQLVYTIWCIPYDIYHDIYHGIYHSKVIYSVIYTMVYTIWYIPCNIP
jgi:hypothetical protein